MKFAKITLLFILSSIMSLAIAGDIKPFNQKDFDSLTAAGKPVVLEVAATWCPVCKQQEPILHGLMTQPAYKDVTLMTIDFDAEKSTLKKFKVGMQSTLVAFKGKREVARSIGDTTPAGIEELIKKAVK